MSSDLAKKIFTALKINGSVRGAVAMSRTSQAGWELAARLQVAAVINLEFQSAQQLAQNALQAIASTEEGLTKLEQQGKAKGKAAGVAARVAKVAALEDVGRFVADFIQIAEQFGWIPPTALSLPLKIDVTLPLSLPSAKVLWPVLHLCRTLTCA